MTWHWIAPTRVTVLMLRNPEPKSSFAEDRSRVVGYCFPIVVRGFRGGDQAWICKYMPVLQD